MCNRSNCGSRYNDSCNRSEVASAFENSRCNSGCDSNWGSERNSGYVAGVGYNPCSRCGGESQVESVNDRETECRRCRCCCIKCCCRCRS